MKKIIILIKKIILGMLFIYAYNKMTLPLNIMIPINIYTVIFVSICGIPAIITLILFSLLFI